MRSIVIGTAGHIDHGKSALVRALTGTDPDRLKEEQERGITIDLGFAHLQLDGSAGEEPFSLAFIDVPGHERFIKNMLAGVSGMDLVLLVVAADESVMPQTREHFHICRLLHVPRGVIVLTKCDLVDEETLAIARLEVRELVAGSFLSDAPIVAVSSRTGEGMATLTAALASVAASVPVRRVDGPVRLPVDRVFSMKGFGTVATGTLVSGRVEIDRSLVVLPRDRVAKVRGLQVHGRAQVAAEAGRRVAINLGGVDAAELARGDTLADRGAFDATRRFDARLDLLAEAPALRQGARVRFHGGTVEVLGRVALSEHPQPGAAYARIHLESPAIVTRGDRFILRAYSPLATIGGGVVLDPRPPRVSIRSATGAGRLRQLDTHLPDDDAALAVFVTEAGGTGLSRATLVSRAGLSYRKADAAVARLTASGVAVLVGNWLVSPGACIELGERLLAALRAHHEAHPHAGGMPREEARERCFRRVAPEIFESVLDGLAAAGRLVARDRLALEGQGVSLSEPETRAQKALELVYRDAGLTPPDVATAAAAAGTTLPVAERMIPLLVRARTLVKVDALVFHGAALERLKADIRRMKDEPGAGRVDVTSFKARFGITRKYAIPLLEYLDRERVTRRTGEIRIVL